MTDRDSSRCARTALAALAASLILIGPGEAAVSVVMTAGAPIDSDCGPLPNEPPPGGFWLYQSGATVFWQINVVNLETTNVSAGVFEYTAADDLLLLSCDPATMTLPPGAVVDVCDPGTGLPDDGFLRITGLSIAGEMTTTILFQGQVDPAAPVWSWIDAQSSFRATGVARTLSTNRDGAPPGPSSRLRIVPTDEWIPVPLRARKTVTDLDGGDVRAGDRLRYDFNIRWKPCSVTPPAATNPDADHIMVNLVDPLPPEVDFVAIGACAGAECFYDRSSHRLFIDKVLPVRDMEQPLNVDVEVRVRPGVAAGTRVCNQSILNGHVLSDDPDDSEPLSPTCVTVTGSDASLELDKTVREVGDGDGFLEPGERARFELTLRNHGTAAVADVVVRDELPTSLTGFDPVTVSVTPASGVNISLPAPAGAGAGLVEWSDVIVAGGGEVLVVFEAEVSGSFEPLLCNQADITSSSLGIVLASDDPATVFPYDPTCMPVVSSRLRGRGLAPPEDLLAGCDFAQLAAGGSHSAAVMVDGTVATWGGNRHGQLGDGGLADSDRPVALVEPTDVISIAAGEYHTVAARGDGSVWAWGDNTWGQLGVGVDTDLAVPIEVPGLPPVIDVSAGLFHSLAAASNGTVWAWGYNREGHLGNGSDATARSPVRVLGVSNIVEVVAGAWHSLARTAAGTVWAWGDNEGGTLGNGTFVDSRAPVRVDLPRPAIAIAGRAHHAFAILDDDSLWAWGWNQAGQIGDSALAAVQTPVEIFANSIADVAGGLMHSLAVRGNGIGFSWGDGVTGRLGNGTEDSQSSPGWITGAPSRTFTRVAAGSRHSLALTTATTLQAWGRNVRGQLGAGLAANTAYLPVTAATLCTVNIDRDPTRAAAVTDSCIAGGGNADGLFEPGERVTIELGLRNSGGIDAHGIPDIIGVLAGPPPAGVTFVNDMVGYTPSILPRGAAAAPDGPFIIDLATDIDCPQTLDLPIQVEVAEGLFEIPFALEVGPCAVQCEDCQPNLAALEQLLMVHEAPNVSASWLADAGALAGYRLYSVLNKDDIPRANLAATARTLECETPSSTVVACAGATPVVDGELLFYQVLAVCGAGLEGPVD